ncbi:DUF2884 family protein [Pseudoxanthomonas indica]|uniref:DUF2884 domain-containing protein n=1 Tax=Pseudoxanthomonas indica TaxID=428993 RepID=A0A1T5K5D2_9GAMM|nr:DUF2884 family protein [Pseudoxanthomonas indica]GGD46918.1 hypothetical protein GCM10007235_18490 [Pseudoxanthomonas indica]SKC58962.1 Protein of unknown function [Pseudoxanthomonas indica]
MRRLPLCQSLLCLALGALAMNAQAKEIRCDMTSDYDLTVNDRSVIFTRESGVPKAVVMRQGRLFVDDRWVSLSSDDSQRIREFEQGARKAMPLAHEIGRDAADIAFTALGEVAAGISNHPDKTRQSLDRARKAIDRSIGQSISANRFNSADLERGIQTAVEEVMPSVIGDVVGGALTAALTGDTARLERMDKLDQQVEARIQPRAKALEARAEKLCAQMRELDRLDDALAYRLPAGGALNLLEEKPDQSHTSED